MENGGEDFFTRQMEGKQLKRTKQISVGLLVAMSCLLLSAPAVKTYAAESQSVTVPTDQQDQAHYMAHDHHHGKGWVDDAAAVLKTDKHTLWKELKAGKSLADIATEKGISKEELKTGLQAKFQARLNEAVKKGELTNDKRNAIMSRFNANLDQMITQKDWAKRVKMYRHFWIGAAAQVLNIDKEALKKELQSGKSLEDVAKEKGISKDQLKAGLQDIQKKRLDELVKQGKMTKEKENQILTHTSEHLDKWISHKKSE